MSENPFDPPQDTLSPEEIKVNYVSFNVSISKQALFDALQNQKKWQDIWFQIVPQSSMKAAVDMKFFVANGFKPLENKDQFEAAGKIIQDLERPLPQIEIMPAGAKVPDNVKKAIGQQGHKLQRPR